MRKTFETQPELFVTSAELDHPALHGLAGAEAVLDWDRLEKLMDGIYGARTGRPSYPLLTLLRSLLLGDESKLYADVAYSSARNRDKLRQLGIRDRVQRKGYRGHPISEADKVRNAEIAVTRSGGERPFATYKCVFGLARTRFMGRAKNLTFYGLATMASNIKKAAKFLMLYGLPEPASTG